MTTLSERSSRSDAPIGDSAPSEAAPPPLPGKGVIIRPSPSRYWKQLRRNVYGPVSVVAGLMAVSVLLRVVAHSSVFLGVAAALVTSVILVALLPYSALVHRSITVGEGRLVLRGLLRSKSIRFEDVGLFSVSKIGPDPQLRVIDVSGETVWRIHLSYWPQDLEERLRGGGSTGRMRTFAPTPSRFL